ncbi:MAG: hypothetical protein FJY10_12155 [Bacteroidetes bacterium]|nr:hypothetical protein [Bacteroidota bacterium]
MAQKISSMVLSLRKKANIRVRQPLGRILIPAMDEHTTAQIETMKALILHEVNVKNLEFITDTESILIKKIKPDFKKLGPRFGKMMKSIAEMLAGFSQHEIQQMEHDGHFVLRMDGNEADVTLEDVEIISEDIPGWEVMNLGKTTVALDIHVSNELKEEGIARELINRLQNIRKEKGFEVTDKISVKVQGHQQINQAIQNNFAYICSETLSESFELVDTLNDGDVIPVEITEEVSTFVQVEKINL